MEFGVEKRATKNIKKYPQTDYEIALRYSSKAYKEFNKLIKGIMLFGSSARENKILDNKTKVHDIDILMLVDDVTIKVSDEVIKAYQMISGNIVNDISDRLHITTLPLSNFWDMVRNGDPIIINILRDGVPLLDFGFFEPIQYLLAKGQIRPTAESMWNYFTRSPASIQNAKWHIMQGMTDLYWAAIDASHAALIKRNRIPPNPTHVPQLLREEFLKSKELLSKDIILVEELYKISKQISKREIKEFSPESFHKYLQMTEEFVRKVEEILHKDQK